MPLTIIKFIPTKHSIIFSGSSWIFLHLFPNLHCPRKLYLQIVLFCTVTLILFKLIVQFTLQLIVPNTFSLVLLKLLFISLAVWQLHQNENYTSYDIVFKDTCKKYCHLLSQLGLISFRKKLLFEHFVKASTKKMSAWR